MGNKIIVGNLKTYMNYDKVIDYINYIKDVEYSNLIICPSYIHIPYFLNNNLIVGSQDVCAYEDTNCTGEVTASQLSSMGVKYTIIGHSARKIRFNETSAEINKKIKCALNSNLKIILCVGEQLNEIEDKYNIIKKQIDEYLTGITDLSNIIIAYEPIWSVGTNKLQSCSDLSKTIAYIKCLIKKIYNQDISVIYGGSIDDKNIVELNKISEIDGFLVGFNSTNPQGLIKIINKLNYKNI